MKKSVIAAALAGVMFLSGCSGVSQNEYNSLLEENEALKSENSSLTAKNSELTSASKTNEDLLKQREQEITELKAEKDKIINESISINDLNDIIATAVHPKNEISSSNYQKDDNGIGLGQFTYTDLTASMIFETPYMDNSSLANVLKNSEASFEATLGDTAARGVVVLYRNPTRQNLCIYLFTSKEKAKWIWFDEELKAEYEAL